MHSPATALPRIAMPARLTPDNGDPRVAGANRIFDDVAALVRAAGLEVVVVGADETDVTDFDGVVLPGGGDVDPARYDGQQISALYDVNPAQDDLDFGIARAALDAGIPLLGVCRGLQVLNVVFGGTLVEDLPAGEVVHTLAGSDSTELEWAWHEVRITPGSRLGARVGSETLAIASAHHQGVGILGVGLTATARAEDGLVEAFEATDHDVIAVQWHPEADGTPGDDALAPFRAFADLVNARLASEDGLRPDPHGPEPH